MQHLHSDMPLHAVRLLVQGFAVAEPSTTERGELLAHGNALMPPQHPIRLIHDSDDDNCEYDDANNSDDTPLTER